MDGRGGRDDGRLGHAEGRGGRDGGRVGQSLGKGGRVMGMRKPVSSFTIAMGRSYGVPPTVRQKRTVCRGGMRKEKRRNLEVRETNVVAMKRVHVAVLENSE